VVGADGFDEVAQGVRVLGATASGEHVFVDIYGGPELVCGSVRFTFADVTEQASQVRVLRGWALTATPLTLVARGKTMSLIDEQALLERALDA